MKRPRLMGVSFTVCAPSFAALSFTSTSRLLPAWPASAWKNDSPGAKSLPPTASTYSPARIRLSSLSAGPSSSTSVTLRPGPSRFQSNQRPRLGVPSSDAPKPPPLRPPKPRDTPRWEAFSSPIMEVRSMWKSWSGTHSSTTGR